MAVEILDCDADSKDPLCLQDCEADPIDLDEIPRDELIRLKLGNKLRCYKLENLYLHLSNANSEPTTRVTFSQLQLDRITRLYRERYDPDAPALDVNKRMPVPYVPPPVDMMMDDPAGRLASEETERSEMPAFIEDRAQRAGELVVEGELRRPIHDAVSVFVSSDTMINPRFLPLNLERLTVSAQSDYSWLSNVSQYCPHFRTLSVVFVSRRELFSAMHVMRRQPMPYIRVLYVNLSVVGHLRTRELIVLREAFPAAELVFHSNVRLEATEERWLDDHVTDHASYSLDPVIWNYLASLRP